MTSILENLKILKTKINVSKVVEQLKKYPQDWDHQKNLKDSQSLIDRGFADLPVSALQLIIGGVKHKDDFVGDSEINVKTPAYAHHSEIRKIIRKHFKNADIHRCGFLSLPIDEIVGAHIDEGTYYLTRNRYHLSILGRYQYFCGKESVIVEPGTLLWFNNDSFFAAEILIPSKYGKVISVSAQIICTFVNMCSYNLINR